MKTVLTALFLGTALLFSSGCGVYMAFTQPPPINTAALEAGGGWSRSVVIEKLGAPRSSVRNADGSREEIYEFYEGSSTGWKVARGIFHLGADIWSP